MADASISGAHVALNSGEWFLRFFIADHCFRHAIHLNNGSQLLRPSLGPIDPRDAALAVFARIMTGLAAEAADPKAILIDATSLKAHRTASSLLLKGGRGCMIWRTKGGMNTNLHAVTDAIGRPIRVFMTAGQVSDYAKARALTGNLQAADWLLADRGMMRIGSAKPL